MLALDMHKIKVVMELERIDAMENDHIKDVLVWAPDDCGNYALRRISFYIFFDEETGIYHLRRILWN